VLVPCVSQVLGGLGGGDDTDVVVGAHVSMHKLLRSSLFIVLDLGAVEDEEVWLALIGVLFIRLFVHNIILLIVENIPNFYLFFPFLLSLIIIHFEIESMFDVDDVVVSIQSLSSLSMLIASILLLKLARVLSCSKHCMHVASASCSPISSGASVLRSLFRVAHILLLISDVDVHLDIHFVAFVCLHGILALFEFRL